VRTRARTNILKEVDRPFIVLTETKSSLIGPLLAHPLPTRIERELITATHLQSGALSWSKTFYFFPS
jgi:hypothetical protein